MRGELALRWALQAKPVDDEDRRRRDLVVWRLKQMFGVSCQNPQGAINTFPNIKGVGLKAQDAAALILEKVGVVEASCFSGAAACCPMPAARKSENA
jgi:aspartate/methionine/tyrosine aminotransferase